MTDQTQECCCHHKTQMYTDPEVITETIISPQMEEKAQRDILFQDLDATALDLAGKLRQKMLLQCHKDTSNRHIYVEACRRLEDTITLLQNKGHAPKSIPESIKNGFKDVPMDSRHGAKEQHRSESSILLQNKADKYSNMSNKLSTALLVRLLPKLTKKNQNRLHIGQADTIWRRLSHLVLAKVKAADRTFMTVQDNIDNITKAMMEDLLRIFVTPENLLRAAMAPDDPIFDHAVLNFLTREINGREKKGRLSRFFSGFKKFFCCGT